MYQRYRVGSTFAPIYQPTGNYYYGYQGPSQQFLLPTGYYNNGNQGPLQQFPLQTGNYYYGYQRPSQQFLLPTGYYNNGIQGPPQQFSQSATNIHLPAIGQSPVPSYTRHNNTGSPLIQRSHNTLLPSRNLKQPAIDHRPPTRTIERPATDRLYSRPREERIIDESPSGWETTGRVKRTLQLSGPITSDAVHNLHSELPWLTTSDRRLINQARCEVSKEWNVFLKNATVEIELQDQDIEIISGSGKNRLVVQKTDDDEMECSWENKSWGMKLRDGAKKVGRFFTSLFSKTIGAICSFGKKAIGL